MAVLETQLERAILRKSFQEWISGTAVPRRATSAFGVRPWFLKTFIFGHAMDLHPANILFFTLAMSSLFGLAGAVLAVPAAALFKIAVDEFYLSHRSLDQARIEAQA